MGGFEIVGTKEEKIRLIINMEDRIIKCKKCKSLLRCSRKPAMGKGELEPDIILVFEMENEFTRNQNYLIELRDLIKKDFGVNKIYHTFLVRCQPKACPLPDGKTWTGDMKLINKEHNCILTSKMCEGIPVRPGNEEILSCLPFLVEEINILKPKTVILFGEKVGEFVLRAFGILDEFRVNSRYESENLIFLTADQQQAFFAEECSLLASLVKN